MSFTQKLDLQRVQKIRKVAVAAGLVAILSLALVTSSLEISPLHQVVEGLGLAMIIICIVGRAWCSLYIGGRKKAEIVDRGPYSISRNPLYVFSFIGAFGIGAQTGSLTLGALFLLLAFVIFYFTVRREEMWLLQAFGAPYQAYCARTPRFGPDFSKWRDTDHLEIKPQFFLLTLRDGLVFLLAIPLFEGIEALQNMGWLGVLLRLP